MNDKSPMKRGESGIRERLMTMQMGQTLKDFSIRCGIPAPTLRKYLTGERRPGMHQLATLSGNLHVSIDWLVTGHHQQTKEAA